MEKNQINVENTYKIIRELGRGSMGVVYEAHNNETYAVVALKVLQLPAGAKRDIVDEMVKRMEREAQIISRLHHPNIVQLYDTGKLNGLPFIAMELCQGTTLDNYLKYEKVFPKDKVKQISMQLLSALGAAHAGGIIHRDIKPQNIILAADGSVKLMDFGVARYESDTSLTQTGQLLGTPSYMSPEQILGKNIDKRSDLFSLACVLCECLAGEKTFAGQTTAAVVSEITSSQPYMLDSLPIPWSGILSKALEKNPEDRYQNAAQMIDDIQNDASPLLRKTDMDIQPHQHIKYTQNAPSPANMQNKNTSAWQDFWSNYENNWLRIRQPYLFTDGEKPLWVRKYSYSVCIVIAAAILIMTLLHTTVETAPGKTYSVYRPPDTATGWTISGIIVCTVILIYVIFKLMREIKE